jgi:uncharacterized membrane protein YedE/YeeE
MGRVLQSIANVIAAGVFGVIFGTGLILSHMVDPARVAGFLDVTGDWNPSLAFVMGGAIVVATPAFWYARRHQQALLGTPFNLPDRSNITWQLVAGAAIFGIGWGLSGICPGPSVVLLASLTAPALVFFATVVVGILLADFVKHR